jgi:hypothetical protein
VTEILLSAQAATTTSINWTAWVSAVGVLVALGIALGNWQHDKKERRLQRTYDAELRQAEHARAGEEQAFADARNVVGGVPQRVRASGALFEQPQLEAKMGPAVINASGSVINNVRLIGARAPLHPDDQSVGDTRWYHRRRSNDGFMSLVLPHSEVEFYPSWIDDLVAEDGRPYYRKLSRMSSQIVFELEVAINWSDSRGNKWIREGHQEPVRVNDWSDAQWAAMNLRWLVRASPDDD